MPDTPRPPGVYGRYRVYGELASGGMATVHAGRMLGTRNFALTVAVKRLRPSLAADPRFVAMFVEEARVASRIRHPNVVPTLDVVEERGEILIVMEYVHGESLARLLSASRELETRPPLPVVSRVVCDVLQGLHAAHEAKSEQGKPLSLVHRDVSPQNVLVGEDGIARVADFGVAKAIDQGQTTEAGEVKGKLAYLAPEQMGGDGVDRRTDIYATGIILWEAVTGARLRPPAETSVLVGAIASNRVPPPSSLVADLPPALEALTMRALRLDPRERFAFASQMADALAEAVPPASHAKVAEWVRGLAGAKLEERRAYLAEIERTPFASELSTSTRRPVAEPVDPQAHAVTEVASSVDLLRNVGRRRWRWAAPLLAGTVGLAAAILWPRLRPSESSEQLRARAVSSVTSGPPTATLPSAPSPPLAAPAGAAPPAHRLPSHRRQLDRRHPPPDGATKRSSTGLDCSIPYTLDRDGVRIPRAECM